MTTMKPRIILASQSFGRRKLLERLGVPFEAMPADMDEDSIGHPDPRETIRLRARAKAENVRTHLLRLPKSPKQPTLIIAADTMVILEGQMYGKPDDYEDALHMLQTLRGKTHIAATATTVLLMDKGKENRRWEETVETKLTMNALPDKELQVYLRRYAVLRFAGCYSLDEAPWNLFGKIEGSYTNVIGLPFEVILPILRTQNLL